MNGIENILAYIKTQSKEECMEIEREASEECERIRAEYAKLEQEEYRKLLNDGAKEAESRLERLNSLAMLESKKHVLMTQQEMVAMVFEHAVQKLLDLPVAEYTALLAKLACNASLNGSETIVLSQVDHKRIGNDVLGAANAAMRKAGKNAAFTLSDKTADIRGGLILSGGDIEVNCSVDALVDEYRNDLSPAVASILFN